MAKGPTTSDALAGQIETKARHVLQALGHGRISPEDIDDLVQGVVERVYRHARDRDPPLRDDDLDAYTARSACNTYNDHWRRLKGQRGPYQQPRPESVQSVLDQADLSTPSEKVIRANEKARRVVAAREALKELKASDLRLYEMSYVEGMSHAEIATALGYKSPDVVKTKLQRLRKRALAALPDWLTLPPHLRGD